MNDSLLNQITLNPETYSKKPAIRNMRFTVAQILDLLASGMTEKEILADYSYLKKKIFLLVYNMRLNWLTLKVSTL